MSKIPQALKALLATLGTGALDALVAEVREQSRTQLDELAARWSSTLQTRVEGEVAKRVGPPLLIATVAGVGLVVLAAIAQSCALGCLAAAIMGAVIAAWVARWLALRWMRNSLERAREHASATVLEQASQLAERVRGLIT